MKYDVRENNERDMVGGETERQLSSLLHTLDALGDSRNSFSFFLLSLQLLQSLSNPQLHAEQEQQQVME